MSYENIFFAAIVWGCALVTGVIALWAFRRKTPMHFWAGSAVNPEEITDIPAYNRANGNMWLAYAAAMALSGIVGLFNTVAGAVLLLVVGVPGIAFLLLTYKRIYREYARKVE